MCDLASITRRVAMTRTTGGMKNQQRRLENRKFQARACLSNNKAGHGDSSVKSQRSGGWDRRGKGSIQLGLTARPWL